MKDSQGQVVSNNIADEGALANVLTIFREQVLQVTAAGF